MNINRFVLSEMSASDRQRIMARVQAQMATLEPVVKDIVFAVEDRGDEALVEYTHRLDGARVAIDAIKVTPAEFEDAEREISSELRSALEQAHANIGAHHREQMPAASWMKEIRPGVISGERITPIASVGLYVPRGKGSFPSVMLMLCTPAMIAEVPRVIVCTPPGPDGTVDAASLVAARICGVTEVFKVGGAQAIAAMAFGTQTIPRVEKISGPGNQYVTAAKRLVYGIVQLGTPAGPSESIILCDAAADPQTAARELLVEAEHGPDSAALLVTDSPELADLVTKLLPDLIAELPVPRKEFVETVLARFGGIVVTGSLAESVEFTNDYAPEHLRVMVADPFAVLHQIVHAGEILLGENTSIAFGNFSIGLNAILPTGGGARSASCVGVHDFLKQSSFAYVTAQGVAAVGPVAIELARWEGFPAHEAAARHVMDRQVVDRQVVDRQVPKEPSA